MLMDNYVDRRTDVKLAPTISIKKIINLICMILQGHKPFPEKELQNLQRLEKYGNPSTHIN